MGEETGGMQLGTSLPHVHIQYGGQRAFYVSFVFPLDFWT